MGGVVGAGVTWVPPRVRSAAGSIIGIGGVTPFDGQRQLTMYRAPYEKLGLAAVARLQQRRGDTAASTVLQEFPGTFIEGTSIAPPRTVKRG